MTAPARSDCFRAVVIAARHLKFGFQLAQLLLKFEKVLARLEIGIIFSERDELAQCKGQGGFGLRPACHIVVGQCARRAAQLGYFFKD